MAIHLTLAFSKAGHPFPQNEGAKTFSANQCRKLLREARIHRATKTIRLLRTVDRLVGHEKMVCGKENNPLAFADEIESLFVSLATPTTLEEAEWFSDLRTLENLSRSIAPGGEVSAIFENLSREIDPEDGEFLSEVGRDLEAN